VNNSKNKYLDHIDEKNKFTRKSVTNENLIVVSELKDGYFPNVVREYSIKFPLNGTEHYKINNIEYHVPEMHFLTASGPCESSGFLESKSFVWGLCINISLNLIDEAFTVLSAEENIDLENNLAGYFKSEKFLEHVFPVSYSELGQKLLKLSRRLQSKYNDFSFINDEMFLELSENVISHESENFKKLSSLSSLKSTTKKEILKRLLFGKNFIDDNFRESIVVRDVAKQSCLSEFHFFRSFKEAFGISPHNYLIKRRLNEALELLKKNNSTVGEIAFNCGFPDIHSFSKSFKKHFGYSPSQAFVKN